MTISFCPNCNARIMVGFGVTDFIHNCSEKVDAPLSITQEDVVVTGNWEDFDGTGTKTAQMVNLQGIGNELWGTRAGIEGKDKEAITRRGQRASTHRQRSHLEFVTIGGKHEKN